ncbi:MAG: hypothetical protein EPO67_15970 [Reyranella sp.]|nr:MAG: hypothetical protein EPO67_15970 [Reyranella sp.]
MGVTYLHLPVGREPPSVERLDPFKAVMVIDQVVTDEWQRLVSDWLVRSGCLYMMAWGIGCSSWDTSVDLAFLSATGFAEVPDDRFVMTTWHEKEPLSETFWFAGQVAWNPVVPLDNVIIVDVSEKEREAQLLKAYSAAQHEKS